MKKIKDIIQEKSKIRRQANIFEAQEAAENKERWLVVKVENYIERFSLDISVEDILVKIKKDYLYAATFAKDPGRQNIAEKVQLEEIGKYCEVQQLPTKGKDALYINNGEISKIKSRTKSIDAIINDTYCSLKYTKDGGGSQDNQRDDIYNTLDASKDCTENFAAIVDGEYWDKELPKLVAEYKNYQNIWIGTSDDWIKEKGTRAV